MPTRIFSKRDLKALDWVKLLVRLALKLSIAFLLISTSIALFLGEKAWYIEIERYEVASSIIFYSLYVGVWVTIISFFTLLLIAVVYRMEKRLTWASFKTDVLLWLGTIACFGIFHLTTWAAFEA